MKKSSLNKNTKNQVSNTSKKGLTKIPIHNFEDVDSLSSFKQKKVENIDDKFMLLKSELHSLFVNPGTKSSKYSSKNETESSQTQDCDNVKNYKDTSSTGLKQSKFSEWLSETIEKMDVKSSHSRTSTNIDCDRPVSPTGKLAFKSKYNMTLLPDHKVERLLYKSFQLKNLGIYVLSSSDESETEQKSSRTRKYKKRKSKRTNVRSARTFSSAFPRKNFKRKRTSLDSEAEIINLEGSLKKDDRKNVDYVDLDVDSFDWSEPFCIESSSDHSDLEIIENTQRDVISNAGKKSNEEIHLKDCDFRTKPLEQNSNKNFINADSKKTWECPICFEPSQGQSIVATLCGHIFCKACLEKHNSTHGKLCPTCRFDLSDKTPIILFNI